MLYIYYYYGMFVFLFLGFIHIQFYGKEGLGLIVKYPYRVPCNKDSHTSLEQHDDRMFLINYPFTESMNVCVCWAQYY